jgi:hypothetical protein
MNKTRPTRIQLKGEGTFEEGRAASAITPGQLLITNSAGNLIPHNVAGGPAEAKFAHEDALQGRTIDDDYASGELVFHAIQRPGDVVFAWAASGEDIENGEFLTSNGDGTLKVASGTQHRVGVALEDADLTDTDAENTRIRVRII